MTITINLPVSALVEIKDTKDADKIVKKSNRDAKNSHNQTTLFSGFLASWVSMPTLVSYII